MAAFVIGIAPTQKVDELEKMLGGAGSLDRSKFLVITTEELGYQHEDSFIEFIQATGNEDVDQDDEFMATKAGDHQFTGDDSSNVPGISRSEPTLHGYLSHPHFAHHVGNLPIPDDEADNYNEAIDDGRAVVAYPADGNGTQIETVLRAAGLVHVKTFIG